MPSPAIDPTAVLGFERRDWLSLAAYYSAITLLHVLGWGLYLSYARAYPALIGLGFAAYAFGLRHAFDADHIAAVDDTVRLMLSRGGRPLGVGFYFSLGHSSVVLLLALAVGLGSGLIREQIPMLQELGSVIGGAVSGSFLWVVGVLNLVVLIRLLRLWRSPASPAHKHDHMEVLLRGRGFLNRLLAGRLKGSIRRSWHMYPLGILFGLGFDTASEIALLSMTAGAAVGNLPLPATLSLPLLFASGMSLMDTSDGVLMVKAYDWAFINPIRKIYYNITTTTLSVLIALSIGTIELIQVGTQLSGADGAFARRVQALDLSWLGYIIVAAFLLLWAVSVLIWNIGQRRARRGAANVSVHEHGDGNFHVHRHFDHD